MRFRRVFLLFAVFVSACGPALELDFSKSPKTFAPAIVQKEAEWMKIIVMDVGQGDAALLIAPNGEAALIDTGIAEIGFQKIKTVMADQDIASVQTIFISHRHEDHNGSLAQIRADPIGQEAILIDNKTATVGETIEMGEIDIAIKASNGRIGQTLYLDPKATEDENSLSMALLIQYNDFQYLTAGDLTGGGGNPPYQTVDLETPLASLIGDIDVLKASHHGSHTSSNDFFLDTLKPETAIISAGEKNDFGHPHRTTLERLQARGIAIWETKVDSVCILSDGKEIQIKPYAVDNCATPP